MSRTLVEEEDFYYDAGGLFVFTSRYLLQRGYCCGNGCRHCPYEYVNVPEPRRASLLASRLSREDDPLPNDDLPSTDQ